ncbi:hypothetical protein V3C99_000576, partial [Haemonchus contortus]
MQLSPETKRSLEQRIKRAPKNNRTRVNPGGDYIFEINEGSNVSKKFYQSDIALSVDQEADILQDIEEQLGRAGRSKRQAFGRRFHKKLWKNATVYYSFNNTISDELRRIFVKATELWANDSCLKFIEDPHAEDRIIVQNSDGCSSDLGRIGGVQKLSLGPGCESVAIAAHELGHVIGFHHTQSRYDRDKFITVDTDNIKRCMAKEYIRKTPETNDNFNLTYDYGSIMHYPGINGAANVSKPTMVPYDINYQATLGSPFVSFIDVSMLNELYGCKKLCQPPTESVTCENGGYPHPLNCQKCVCPRGYSGVRCTERPDNGCGSTLTASPEWKSLTDSIGDKDSFSTRIDFSTCNYWIESPNGTEIEVEILKIYNQYDTDGCPYAGVEIKTNKNQQLTGYRFCSPFAKGITLRSYTNRVPIFTYNRAHLTTVTLRYRSIDPSKPRPTYQTVKPFPTTTVSTTPTTTTSTSTVIDFRRSGRKCVDQPKCPIYVMNGLCTRDYFPERFRMEVCPKACH